ncbi:HAMP domain-containing sensor histidine kinase [Hyphomonas chukchiensis]|uniref:sensor histidine kinase n=1 Tax=Hyphomonas chukchiensis TaxID=1280947 RepID=UPI0030FA67E8
MKRPGIASFLVVRLLAVAVLAIFASQLLLIAILWRAQAGSGGFRLPLPARAAAMVESIDAIDPGKRQSLITALNTGDLHVRIEPELAKADISGGRKVDAFRRAMTQYTEVLNGRRVVGMVGSGRRRFEEPVMRPDGVQARYPMRLIVELASGEWLVIETPSLIEARFRSVPVGLFAGFFGLGVASIALWSIWRALRPVRDMAQSARVFSATGVPQMVRPAGGGELRNLVAEYNGLQTRVARLQANRTLVMSAMSHDVRTYLTRLRLRIESLEPESRDAAEKTIEDIKALLDDSLAFAQVDGEFVCPEPILLSTVLEKIVQSGQFPPERMDVSVVTDNVVLMEPSRLERALVNIIANAVKYGGKAKVVVGQSGADAEVSVSDEGPGIPVAFREKVFEPFFRMEESRNRSEGGAGLGLAISRRLIERRGGTITLKDANSGGLTVTVTLPRA